MRILFVAMPTSIHAARWINGVAELGHDVHVFPSIVEPPHSEFRNVTVYTLSTRRPPDLHPSVRVRGLWPFKRGSRKVQARVARVLPTLLANLIRVLHPQVVHSMEFQYAGYLTLEARRQLGEFPPWIVENWGSDIYLFGRLAEHRDRIRELLQAADFYACECERDVGLARAHGFTGEVLPVRPIAGGLDLDMMASLRQPGPTSARRSVVLKGYQGWAGRSLVGLRALELVSDALNEYRVVVTSAFMPEVGIAAELLASSTGLRIDVVPQASHQDVLRFHGAARVSIGLSISDAIPQGALEAVAMGSFPIQSETSCLGEWVEPGRSGFLVHPEDPAQVAEALRRALVDDELVDRASEHNAEVIRRRASCDVVRLRAEEIYERVRRV